MIIIATHVVATILAVCALLFHDPNDERLLVELLAIEITFVACGFGIHRYLHSSEALATWAMARLLAETTRSALAVCHVPIGLDYLAALQFPSKLRPILKSINVFHLMQARRARQVSLDNLRIKYVASRLDGDSGQIHYYESKAKTAKLWL